MCNSTFFSAMVYRIFFFMFVMYLEGVGSVFLIFLILVPCFLFLVTQFIGIIMIACDAY